jgi:hypothetical protein
MMNELSQKSSESPSAWLARLGAVDEGKLSLAERRARAGYLADARRLVEQERQKGRWGSRRA